MNKGCGRLNNTPPQNVHILVPRTCEYATFHGKRDFADVIKGLQMGRVSWITRVGPV